jgi:hypothetical protein
MESTTSAPTQEAWAIIPIRVVIEIVFFYYGRKRDLKLTVNNRLLLKQWRMHSL